MDWWSSAALPRVLERACPANLACAGASSSSCLAATGVLSAGQGLAVHVAVRAALVAGLGADVVGASAGETCESKGPPEKPGERRRGRDDAQRRNSAGRGQERGGEGAEGKGIYRGIFSLHASQRTGRSTRRRVRTRRQGNQGLVPYWLSVRLERAVANRAAVVLARNAAADAGGRLEGSALAGGGGASGKGQDEESEESARHCEEAFT